MLSLAAKLVAFFWRRADGPEETPGLPGPELPEGASWDEAGHAVLGVTCGSTRPLPGPLLVPPACERHAGPRFPSHFLPLRDGILHRGRALAEACGFGPSSIWAVCKMRPSSGGAGSGSSRPPGLCVHLQGASEGSEDTGCSWSPRPEVGRVTERPRACPAPARWPGSPAPSTPGALPLSRLLR